jgi:hypothetical protein
MTNTTPQLASTLTQIFNITYLKRNPTTILRHGNQKGILKFRESQQITKHTLRNLFGRLFAREVCQGQLLTQKSNLASTQGAQAASYKLPSLKATQARKCSTS